MTTDPPPTPEWAKANCGVLGAVGREVKPYSAALNDFRRGVLPLSEAIREAEADGT